MPKVANVFIPHDRSHRQDDCSWISHSEAVGARCSLLSEWKHVNSRPLIMRPSPESGFVPSIVVRWKNNAEDYADEDDTDVKYGVIIDTAPRFSFLEARMPGALEAYCVYSKGLRDDGAVTVTWIQRPLVQ